jgi:hypothetical protein
MKTNPSTLKTFFGLAAVLVLTVNIVGQSASAQAGIKTASMEDRSAFATQLETQLRSSGNDVQLRLAGDSRDQLLVESPTMSRNSVYAFVNSDAVHTQASRLGFRTVTLTNGSQSWDYDVNRESLVWNTALSK